jgi:hypothetical protein
MAMKIHVVTLNFVTPRSDTVENHRFGEPCCPRLQGEILYPTILLQGVTSQKPTTDFLHRIN